MSLNFAIDSSVGSFGHHFLVGLEGSKLTENERLDLGDLRPLGIQLRRRNFAVRGTHEEWLEDLAALIAEVKSAIGRDRIVVAIEEDGAGLHITPAPLTNFGDPLAWGEKASQVGRALAVELRSLGVNFYLGPVADVRWRLARQIAGQLAIGETADDATLFSCAVAQAMMSEGMAVAPKHFPGQGHAHLPAGAFAPRVDIMQEELAQGDMRPFAALIDIGAPAIMGTSYVVAAIDPDAPAGISPKVIRGVLRERMQFQGVVVSCEIDHDEVTRHLTDSDIIRNALTGSVDILRVTSTERAILFAQGFFDALMVRLVTEDGLRDSFDRIERFFEKIGDEKPQVVSEGTLAEHRDLVASLG